MPEEFADTSSQSNETRYEAQITLLLSLLLMSLAVSSFTLGELNQSATGALTRAFGIEHCPTALLAGALGTCFGFLACFVLTDKLGAASKLTATFPVAIIALVVGFALYLCGFPLAAAFFGLAVVFVFIQWIRLSKPISSHSYYVASLTSCIIICGAFSCFVNATSALDRKNLLVLALCFLVASCFFNYLFCLRKHFESEELPSRAVSAMRSRAVTTTFRPAIIDGFILGLCLRSYYEGAVAGIPVGISLGFAMILSACLSCLQLVPRSNYEKFARNHAGSFKIIPLLLPVLFGSEYLLITGAISLFITMTYTIFLMTSLNDRILILELSPFYTYGTHGAVFFICMIAGIAFMPAFYLIHIDAPLWSTLAFLVVLVAMEWLLVGTIGRKSYIDPESNRLSTREKMTQAESSDQEAGGDATDAASRASAFSARSCQMHANDGKTNPMVNGTAHHTIMLADGTMIDEASASDTVSRWSNHIRMMAELYGLSARQEEVLFLLAKGRTAQFIADKLTITLATSKSHIYNIYIKFGVHSQQELLNLLESEEN